MEKTALLFKKLVVKCLVDKIWSNNEVINEVFNFIIVNKGH